ncbi:DinB family protein [Paenibacillus thermotolerans]|uniref:DinB family protein n=1 Tax=Paenibacillus thermotolerans TaxID=3027807 RepID=UPI0023680A84|nr:MULTISPECIES: DinB family protein [unclassified Paenibacillus]
MEHYIFTHLAFVRGQTLKQLEGVTEETADRIPEPFNNSIRWNAGHIYVVLERYAFQYLGLPQHLPAGFKERFEFGTSPSNHQAADPAPTLEELKALLQEQPARIRAALEHRLQEEVPQPYTTSSGITLRTPEQFLAFNLFHEGMHVSVIKHYKKLLS